MRIFTLAFAAASVAVLACAGPEDLASESATLTDFCHARAKTECNAAVVSSCQLTDQTSCITQREASCNKSVPQGTVYVPAAGPACLEAVGTTYATATITATALAALATACEPIFSGPGAARSQCTVDYDCSTKDGLRCLTPANQTQGKCLVPNMIDPAGACPGEADVCSGAYFCDPKALVCVAEGGAGSQCSPGVQPCMQGFTCPGSIFLETCQPLKAAGDACVQTTDCASNLCDKATGQSQGVCADQIQLTALDSMCAVYQ